MPPHQQKETLHPYDNPESKTTFAFPSFATLNRLLPRRLPPGTLSNRQLTRKAVYSTARAVHDPAISPDLVQRRDPPRHGVNPCSTSAMLLIRGVIAFLDAINCLKCCVRIILEDAEIVLAAIEFRYEVVDLCILIFETAVPGATARVWNCLESIERSLCCEACSWRLVGNGEFASRRFLARANDYCGLVVAAVMESLLATHVSGTMLSCSRAMIRWR